MTNEEKLRRHIILGNHPECESYEEALNKELIFGCKIKRLIPHPQSSTVREYESILISSKKGYWHLSQNGIPTQIKDGRQIKSLGLPINLDRVMQALLNTKLKNSSLHWWINGDLWVLSTAENKMNNISWKLNKELSEQDEKTKDELLKLFEIK